jgi:hypothetical protein
VVDWWETFFFTGKMDLEVGEDPELRRLDLDGSGTITYEGDVALWLEYYEETCTVAVDWDEDGIGDGHDNCPETANPNQEDNDGDGEPGTQPPAGATWGGDACDSDDDNDTVLDGDDDDPFNPYLCRDLDSDTCDDCSVLGQADPSNDGPDNDADGACDAGDPDDDNDGVPDDEDANPLNPFVCRDLDSDTCDDCSVLGYAAPSNDGADNDADGACDAGDPDDDNDGLTDTEEPAIGTDPLDGDTDDDDISDGPDDPDGAGSIEPGPDNCPLHPNHDQTDTDGDGLGNE